MGTSGQVTAPYATNGDSGIAPCPTTRGRTWIFRNPNTPSGCVVHIRANAAARTAVTTVAAVHARRTGTRVDILGDEAVHVRGAIVFIGLMPIVASAVEGQVLVRGSPSPRERHLVVELQLVRRTTAAAVHPDECAAALVAFENLASEADRYVSRRRFASPRPDRFQTGSDLIHVRSGRSVRPAVRAHFQPGSGLIRVRSG